MYTLKRVHISCHVHTCIVRLLMYVHVQCVHTDKILLSPLHHVFDVERCEFNKIIY